MFRSIYRYIDKIQESIEQRLAAWVDIFKESDSLRKQQMELIEQKMEVMEGRMQNIDRWCQQLALGAGVGAPSHQETEFPDEPREDPMADSSLEAMLGVYNDDDLVREMMDNA